MTGAAIARALHDIDVVPALAAAISGHGLATILARHTFRHRGDELPAIADSIPAAPAPETAP